MYLYIVFPLYSRAFTFCSFINNTYTPYYINVVPQCLYTYIVYGIMAKYMSENMKHQILELLSINPELDSKEEQ